MKLLVSEHRRKELGKIFMTLQKLSQTYYATNEVMEDGNPVNLSNLCLANWVTHIVWFSK